MLYIYIDLYMLVEYMYKSGQPEIDLDTNIYVSTVVELLLLATKYSPECTSVLCGGGNGTRTGVGPLHVEIE